MENSNDTIKVRIFYIFSLHRRLKEKKTQSADQSESGWDIQQVDGVLTKSEWVDYQNLPWIKSADDHMELRCHNLPAIQAVKIAVECHTVQNSSFNISLRLLHDSNDYGWQPDRVFTSPSALLSSIKQNPEPFLVAESTFQDMLMNTFRVVADKIWSGLENDQLISAIDRSIDILDRALTPFSRIIDAIEWKHFDANGRQHDNGNYRWMSKHPLRYELSRLMFFVAQNIMFSHHPIYGSGLQLLKAPLAKKLDLSFIKDRRSPMTGKPEASKAPKTARKDPGFPGRSLDYWDELMNFSVKREPHFWVNMKGGEFCRATLVLMDYAEKLGDAYIATWEIDSFVQFMTDAKYREMCMKPIPVEYFNQDSPLDLASNYWIAFGKKESESDLSSFVQRGVQIIRAFDQYKKAQELGLLDEEVFIYDSDEIKRVKRRLSTVENNKSFDYQAKLKSHLDYVSGAGHVRYLAPLQPQWNPDDLIRNFPNFADVCLSVKRQLQLCRMQPQPVVQLNPILIVGDPGVGKTRFASALAESLKVEFHEISMSSMTAGWILSGLDLSWANGKQGQVSETLVNGLSANPLVILDEIDKVANVQNSNPYGPLYQLLEKHTAEKFMDEALRMRFNAKHIMWFATANDLSVIPGPILDRFEIIEIKPLTKQQTKIVARSIYHDMRQNHPWGEAFAIDLDDDVIERMHGLNARDMSRKLRTACAIAAERSDRPVIIQVSDIEEKQQKSSGFGFVPI
jgi:ATP-dependent Lon protease